MARKILQMYSDTATKGEVLRTGSKRKKTAVDRTRATSSATAKISSSSLLPLTLRPGPATAGPFSGPETLVPKPLKQKQPPPRPQQAGFGDLSPSIGRPLFDSRPLFRSAHPPHSTINA